jgi:hypothetical protein
MQNTKNRIDAFTETNEVDKFLKDENSQHFKTAGFETAAKKIEETTPVLEACLANKEKHLTMSR